MSGLAWPSDGGKVPTRGPVDGAVHYVDRLVIPEPVGRDQEALEARLMANGGMFPDGTSQYDLMALRFKMPVRTYCGEVMPWNPEGRPRRECRRCLRALGLSVQEAAGG